MLLRRFCFCALCLLLFCGLPCHGSELSLRGVFVSTVSNLDFPSSPGLSPEEMKGELDTILQNAQKAGLNSIFFQVRPCADALYPSSIFPYSRYLTGNRAKPHWMASIPWPISQSRPMNMAWRSTPGSTLTG